jgi:hypothetical protein
MQTETLPQQNSSLELTKASYKIATKNYESILQAMENIVFSKDTLDQDYAPLKLGRALIKQLDDLRKERKQPHLDAGKREDEAAKSLMQPLEEILARKTLDYTQLANEIKAEREAAHAEASRKQTIQDTMQSFILGYSQRIAAATSFTELIKIEQLINLETGRKEKYQEFLEIFKVSCEPLRDKLKAQKENLKSLAALELEVKEATDKGLDEQVMELFSQKEDLEQQIELGKTLVQETAMNTVQNQTEYAEVVLPTAPKARRTQWEVELVDATVALRYAPEMINLTLDTVKAKAQMKVLREDARLKDQKDFTVNGIRYYEKSIY